MNKQALFDFDGTITSKDTTMLLLGELIKLKPWRLFGLIWFLLRMTIAKKTASKQRYKNKAIGYLIKGLCDEHLSEALQGFSNKVKYLYRPSVLSSIDQAIEDGCIVLIVTASPSFAIRSCLSDLSAVILGTEFEKKENIYTGLLKGDNCYGQEKVNRINEWAVSNKISLSIESAWGDDFSDFDMLSMSANRNWVGGNQLRKLIMKHDPEANFIDTKQ